jgi:hypothetical protein
MPAGVYERTDKHKLACHVPHPNARGQPQSLARKRHQSKVMKGRAPWNKGRKNVYSKETLEKFKNRIVPTGIHAHAYKGECKYTDIHGWIHSNYGVANRCENKNCNKTSKVYDWALVHNKQYARDRTIFKMLCRSCHFKYDKTHKKGWITRKLINKK